MSKVIDQKEYLKKYLGGKKSGEKKKKKKKPHVSTGMKIVDDDEVNLNKLRTIEDIDLLFLGQDEDAPQIAGIIDDRPEDIINKERFAASRWKVVNKDDGVSSKLTVEQIKTENSEDTQTSDISSKKNDTANDSDLSPRRQKKKKHKDSDSDLSPPRRKNKNDDDDSDLSPPRHKKSKNDDDSDLSPPRRKKTKNYDSDLSPPRHKKNRNANGSDSDLSPDRNRHKKNSQPSKDSTGHNGGRSRDRREKEFKARKSRWDTDDSHRRSPRREKQRHSSEDRDSNKKMHKTLDGKKAGLQDARQLRDENEELRQRENEIFAKLGDDFSGRNAAAIKRDIRSDKKKLTEEDIRKQKEQEEKQKERDAKYSRWGKGLKQVQEHEDRVKDFLHESSKPLARYKDDDDLEEALRSKERIGDPMLQYMRSKKSEIDAEEGVEPKPMYMGAYPVNRFNIPPGHRWDGVDRSNGYEKNYFQVKSNKEAQLADSYKWSTEDM